MYNVAIYSVSFYQHKGHFILDMCLVKFIIALITTDWKEMVITAANASCICLLTCTKSSCISIVLGGKSALCQFEVICSVL